MEKKDKNYFVKIDSDFLFDKKNIFKSRYTPWVYLYLKLKYNYYIQKLPNNRVSLNTEEIGGFFKIDRSTVHRCLNELRKFELIEKNERNQYKVYSEQKKFDFDSDSYIQVYNNLILNLFQNGGSIDEAKVYYYMVQDNKHYAFEQPYMESNLTQTKISKILRFDPRKTKAILNKLLGLGLITKDDGSKFYLTRHPREGSIVERGVNEQDVDYSTLIDGYIESYENIGETVPVCGWFKTSSGLTELPIIKVPDFGYVVDQRYAKDSDGVPPSNELMKMQIKMVTDNLGKKMCLNSW